jgi:hypothetical protein
LNPLSFDFYIFKYFAQLKCLRLAGEVYIRYLSYNNAEHLKADLIKRLPIKIDIGAATPLLCYCSSTFIPSVS